MNNEIEILSDENIFRVSQTKYGYIKSWVYNTFVVLILNGCILWILYIIQKSKFSLGSIILNVLFFIFFMLIRRKSMRKIYVEIRKINHDFCINNKIFFTEDDINYLVFKKNIGEPLINFDGHLFVKIKNKNHLISYSISYEELNRLKKRLLHFFSLSDIAINTSSI